MTRGAAPALLLAALSGCGATSENAISNSGVMSAKESEQEYMANGMSGERSSGPSGIAGTNLGTTGQSKTAGSSPGPDAAQQNGS